MKTLSVLVDQRGTSEEIDDALVRLKECGTVTVHVNRTSARMDIGVPFPVAVANGTREYGREAVLALIDELIEQHSASEAETDRLSQALVAG